MSTTRKSINDPAQSANSKSFDTVTTSYSAGIKRVYLKNKALSIFMKNDHMGNVAMGGLRADECITDLKYGHRQDTNHATWHKSKKDFEINHSHILKTNGEIVTPTEFKCILDGFVHFGMGYNYQIKSYNMTSTYTQDQCILIDPSSKILDPMDYERLLKKYEDFYYGTQLTAEQKANLLEEIQTKMNELSASVSVRMDEGLKALALAFFNTVLHKYVKPFLIDKANGNNNTVAWGCEVLSSAFTLALSHSPLKVGFGFMLRNTIKPALLKVGIDVSTAESLLNQLSIVAAITEDPTQLAQLGINISFAETGKNLAYNLIKQLPKLRQEPAINNASANTDIVSEIPEGLRKRNVRM